MTGVEEAALAFEILSAGVGLVAQGDIRYTGPTGPVGVTATGIPDATRARLRAHTVHQEIFSYHSSAIAGEVVSVKINCYVQYNGPEVQASFQFPSDGMRSRWGADTTVSIGEPLSIDRGDMPASGGWHDVGILQYPIVRVPVSIFVDERWPTDNSKVTFMLVLCGLSGLGSGPGTAIYEDYSETND